MCLRVIIEKILENRMLVDYCWLYLPRDKLVEELGDLQAETKGNQVQKLVSLLGIKPTIALNSNSGVD